MLLLCTYVCVVLLLTVLLLFCRRARSQQRQVQVVGGRNGLHLRRAGRLLDKFNLQSSIFNTHTHEDFSHSYLHPSSPTQCSVRIRLHWATLYLNDSFVSCSKHLTNERFFALEKAFLFVIKFV